MSLPYWVPEGEVKNYLPWVWEPNPEIYLSKNYVVLDFETTNKNKGNPVEGDNRLVLACWYQSRTDSYHYCFGNEFEQGALLQAIAESNFVVAHNSKFELGWLKRCGVDLHKVLPYCTLLGEFIDAGNRRRDLSLDGSCERRKVGVSKYSPVSVLIKTGVCPSEIPRPWLLKYCLLDVKTCHRLFLEQLEVLRTQGQLGLALSKNMLTPCLVDIEFNGMPLDVTEVRKTYQEWSEKHGRLTHEWAAFSEGVNPGSHKQLNSLLFEELGFAPPRTPLGEVWKTKTGYAVSKDAIAALVPKNGRQEKAKKLLLALGDMGNAIDTLEKMHNAVCAGRTHIYASIGQSTAGTQRLNSKGGLDKIQFQNIDLRFRPCYCAGEKDRDLVDHDYSQLEYKTAVFYGQDTYGMEFIRRGGDAHRRTATRIFSKEDAEVTDEERKKSKAYTFKPLYGGSKGTPGQQEYFKWFMEVHEGISAKHQEWLDSAIVNKWTLMPTGLKFYWPHAKYRRNGSVEGKTNIVNYPVQYLASAEILVPGLVYLWHLCYLYEWDVVFRNTVHDSIITDVHQTFSELFAEYGVKVLSEAPVWFLKRVYGIDFNVPLTVEYKRGYHWK